MTVVITLPFSRPPLRPNERPHWARKARIIKQMREMAAIQARLAKVGPQEPSVVTAIWHAPDRRRRDTSSLDLLIKASIDGLVDAGLWPDDNPAHVVETRCRVIPGPSTSPRIELHITPADTADLELADRYQREGDHQ
ncbi:hypothetical protein GYA93_19535 [Gordonia desulfuricans]|uniref:Uncharacterized protein n=1 Tax=Gordonia desulfuricans TaxID=89051 RepID=A0A7K3LTZ3_9ACTN|nr:hypothetical protein [Gordonia desulfuricans]NDK91748.1 hypothetical protein [Gordonia desulfuricans]